MSIVLITGASSGIGREVALAHARRGDTVVLTSRSADRLTQLALACTAAGGTARTMVADVTEPDQVRRALADTVAQFGGVDEVVHSAAVAGYGGLARMPDEVWDRIVDVDVRGTCVVARESLRVFERAGTGTLVLIGSVLGTVAVPLLGPYVMSKWAVHGLARVLQQEYRDHPGIDVVLVSPGSTDTSLYRTAATYVGRHGSPPPPAYRPQRVAAAVLAAADRGRRHRDAGWTNPLLRWTFRLLPGPFDRLARPAMQRFALGEPAPDTTGGVFRAVDPEEALR
jgi:NAD(P)-dependent dehydrogenase (short-subunit alcohol dehydrogenase family)